MLGTASLLKTQRVVVPRGASAPVLPVRKAAAAEGLLVGCPFLSNLSALCWGMYEGCLASFHVALARVTGLPLRYSSGARLWLCEGRVAAERFSLEPLELVSADTWVLLCVCFWWW